VASVKAGGNSVGCYVSAGTLENWRTDVKALSKQEMGEIAVTKPWDEWPGEFFIWNVDKALPFMKKRIDTFADAGCDYIGTFSYWLPGW
jgi:hypothetical protein